MSRALITHILLIAFGVQALLAGTGGLMLCLGGGHEHGPSESDHCFSACAHESAWPIPFPADHQDGDCRCNDVELQISELPTLPRIDLGTVDIVVIAPAIDWGVVLVDSGLGRRGPPLPPPAWFDPAGEQRLKLVSSVVLTI